MHVIARLHVPNLNPRALVTPTDEIAAVATKADHPHSPLTSVKRPPANPVCRVPQCDERVGTASGNVGRRRRHLYRVAGSGVWGKGVEGLHGRVVEHFHGAVAHGQKELLPAEGEGRLICLLVFAVRAYLRESISIDAHQDIVLHPERS